MHFSEVVLLFVICATFKQITCSNSKEGNIIYLHKLIKNGYVERHFFSSKCISLYELHEKRNLTIDEQIDVLIWSLHNNDNNTELITFDWFLDQSNDSTPIDEKTVLHINNDYILHQKILQKNSYEIQITHTNVRENHKPINSVFWKLFLNQPKHSKTNNNHQCLLLYHTLSQYLLLCNNSEASETKPHSTALFLVDILKYIPMNSLKDIYVTTSVILKDILPFFDTKLDLNFLKEVDNLCHKMVLKQISLITAHAFPHKLHGQVRTLSSLFIELSEFVARNSERLQVMVTESEEHSNSTSHKVNLLIEIVHHLYDIRRLLADAVLATKATKGDTIIKSNAKGSQTVIITASGNELHNRFIDINEVRIFTPQDFQASDIIYNTVISNWKEKHAEFSNHQPNNLVDIEFQNSVTKQLVTTFESPIHIFFDIVENENLGKNVETINYTVPVNLYSHKHQILNIYMFIYAVEVPEMETLFVKFSNIHPNHSLDVIIKEFNTPDVFDFMDNTSVTANSSPLIYRNNLHYPVIVYIGVMPNKEMLNKVGNGKRQVSITFDLSLNTFGCYSRSKTSVQFKKDCKIGQFTSPKMVHCKCHHLSIVIIRPSKQKVQMWSMLYRNRKYYLATSNMLMATFAFFCLLFLCIGFVFALGRSEMEIYYIPDNLWAERFAYLINIKTGFGRTSGTSSNVVIKLIGKRFNSRPHVLNFPDQSNSLLQRQANNLFILTTDKYISQIVSIELWLDGRGNSPTWYCNYVKILDLQYRSEWYFAVNKKLCYTQGESNWIRIKRTKEYLSPEITIADNASTSSVDDAYATAGRECSIKLSRHEMSFYAKVSLGISTVLTGYVLTQVVFDFPTFNNRVVYNNYALNTGNYYHTATLVVPLISFVIHSLLGYLFQNSASQFLNRERCPTIFSFKVTVLSWSIVVSLLLLCFTFVILVDTHLAHISFYSWISCIAYGILFQVARFFNFYMFAGICFAFFKSSSDVYIRNTEINNIIEETEQKRRYLHVTFSGNGLRPYLKHLYYPPHPLLRPYGIYIREIMEDWHEFFDNLIMIILYAFCLEYGFFVLIPYEMDLSRRFLNNVAKMENYPIPKTIDGSYDRTLMSVWNYAKRLNDEKGNAVVLGRMRIQQVRVKQQPCNLPREIEYLKLNCIPARLTDESEEIRPFLQNWILSRIPEYSEPIFFKYSLPEYTSINQVVKGDFGNIPGGGYMLYVNSDMFTNELLYEYLKNNNWLDDNTVFIVISAHLLDGNSNLIYFPYIIMHFDSTGYVTFYNQHNTAHLLFTVEEIRLLFSCILVVVSVWIAVIVFKKMVGIVRKFTMFLQDFWTAVDLMVIASTLISYCMISITGTLIKNYLSTVKYLDGMPFTPYSHIYSTIVFWDLFSFLIIICIIGRIIKLLRTFNVFRVMEKSFVLGAVPLLSLLFCMGIILLSNAVVCFVLYGEMSVSFKSVQSTFASLILLSFHYSSSLDSEVYSKYRQYGKSGVTFLVLFLVTTLLFYNIVKTVIVMSFVRAKQYFEEEIGVNYSNSQFLSDIFKRAAKMCRLGGGFSSNQNKSQIMPKSNEFAFENVYLATNNELKYLKYASLCYIRNVIEKPNVNNPITEYDYKLMKKSVELSLHKQEGWDNVQKFTKCRFHGEEYHFIDDLRIEDIKKCVQAIITPNMELEEAEHLDTIRRNMLSKSQKNLEAVISILENFVGY